ncbi:MAG: hypothetical protein HQK54_18180, partial [Oligoflexales bacterium]|nr:hypothetical protein [Oligoflexales bacterium]
MSPARRFLAASFPLLSIAAILLMFSQEKGFSEDKATKKPENKQAATTPAAATQGTTEAPSEAAKQATKIISGTDLGFITPPDEVIQAKVRKKSIARKRKTWKGPAPDDYLVGTVFGRLVLKEALAEFPPRITDEGLAPEAYLNTLSLSLASGCGFSPLRIVISRKERGDLIPLPGRMILVTEGLLKAVENEAEMAALILTSSGLFEKGYMARLMPPIEKIRELTLSAKTDELKSAAKKAWLDSSDYQFDAGERLSSDFFAI